MGAFAVAAYVTANNGNWSDGATWLSGNVPPVGASVIINHTITMDVSPTVNNGDSMIVNGTLVCGYNTVGGTGKVIIYGIVKTPNGAGFSGATNTSFSNTLSSLTLGPSSTVEYNGVFNTVIRRTIMKFNQLKCGRQTIATGKNWNIGYIYPGH